MLYFATSYKIPKLLAHAFFPTNSLIPTSSRTSALTEPYIMFSIFLFKPWPVTHLLCVFSNPALNTNLLIFFLLFSMALSTAGTLLGTSV